MYLHYLILNKKTGGSEVPTYLDAMSSQYLLTLSTVLFIPATSILKPKPTYLFFGSWRIDTIGPSAINLLVLKVARIA